MSNEVRGVQAIPTNYKGVRFRSRLEAKWAAFFDLLQWKWEYEPTDFRGWIPDFVILGKRTVFVEVKPVFSFPESVAKKIDASGCEDEVLILGASGPVESQFDDHPALGWLKEDDCWDVAVMSRWSKGKGVVGFCHTVQGFTDRISGEYDGGSFGDHGFALEQARELWGHACSIVQWKPR